MFIMDLLEKDTEKINQTARLLHESFEAWPTIDSAKREVFAEHARMQSHRCCR